MATPNYGYEKRQKELAKKKKKEEKLKEKQERKAHGPVDPFAPTEDQAEAGTNPPPDAA
ncbi:MAG: hypothetical protein HYX43_17305 [Burkholderiales bacterium]|nr:hypothetical protein [Burkholderiales bacterium]